MKRIFFYFLTAACISSFASCTTAYVVKERPAEVVYTRPAPPSREHIWISGDWVWIGGHYQWHEGRWDRRREGYRWEDGRWQEARGGYKWVSGHWTLI